MAFKSNRSSEHASLSEDSGSAAKDLRCEHSTEIVLFGRCTFGLTSRGSINFNKHDEFIAPVTKPCSCSIHLLNPIGQYFFIAANACPTSLRSSQENPVRQLSSNDERRIRWSSQCSLWKSVGRASHTFSSDPLTPNEKKAFLVRDRLLVRTMYVSSSTGQWSYC